MVLLEGINMVDVDLKRLEKMIDEYFDNLTERKLMEDMKKKIDEMERSNILEELENGNNVIAPVRKRKKKRPGNKRFNNQGTRKRG
jgi:predicted Zn-dependent protease with MMP-like domain